jgi:hypothetical protein
MFKDIVLSKEMHAEFIKNPNNTVEDIELTSVQILTNGNWPIDEQVNC